MVFRRFVCRRFAAGLMAATMALFPVSGCSGGGDAAPGNLGLTPTITTGQVTFVNHCAVELTLLEKSPDFPAGRVVGKLGPNGGALSKAFSEFKEGAGVNFLPYPNTTTIPDGYCDGWTALGGGPATTQRMGFMWEGTNAAYAAYCNPDLSGRGICHLQKNCSGSDMVQNGNYGTHWEFNRKGGGANDYVDLSTNYGSDSHTPPSLCPAGAPGDCVSSAANIFFNVPIKWTTNKECSFTTAAKKVKGLECLMASCQDAYRHPIDDKQCACPSGNDSGYLVEYCPDGAPLPPLP